MLQGTLLMVDCKVVMNIPNGLYITGPHRLSGVFFAGNGDYDIGGTSLPDCKSYCFAGNYGNFTGCATVSGVADSDVSSCTCPNYDGCVACPAGSSNDRDYSTSIDDCSACGAGLISSSSGSTNCSSCTAGKYASNDASDVGGGLLNPVAAGATVCNPCPAGYQAPRELSFICQACDAGRTSAAGCRENKEKERK